MDVGGGAKGFRAGTYQEATPSHAPKPGSMARGYAYGMEQSLMECVDIYSRKTGLKKDQPKAAAPPFLDESKERPCWVDEEIGSCAPDCSRASHPGYGDVPEGIGAASPRRILGGVGCDVQVDSPRACGPALGSGHDIRGAFTKL